MSDNVVVYFVGWHGTVYEADLLSGTYFGFSDPERLGARQRLLTKAGVPWKNYDLAEPFTMDQEFGKEIINPASISAVQATANFLADAANAANASLAVLLSQNSAPLVLVKDTEDPAGPVYAVGPGVFYWITSGEQIGSGQTSGIYSKNVVELNSAGVAKLRAAALQANSDVFKKAPATDK